MSSTRQQVIEKIKTQAEYDLFSFARLVNPQYEYGSIHEEVFRWMTKEDAKNNQLILLPRGHLKSHMIAVWCAWWITKHPETSILYVSATSTLAEAQLLAIKNILTSKNYMKYWSDMINPEEGKREKWSMSDICVDHPKRKEEGTRDSTVKAVGLTSTTTGLHADVIISDDVVVPQNAYTEEGRHAVSSAMSQMASIKNADGITKAVGTRYHPKDLYSIWKEQKKKVYDSDGVQIGVEETWEIFEKAVEEDGVFLWERRKRADGKSFGFDFNTLAAIESEYEDRGQFFAQYYNNPNQGGTERIKRDLFQYYDRKFIRNIDGDWYYKNEKLNVFAAMDFAYTVNKRSDYSAISVIGVDSERNYYILDLDRFKTEKISVYFEHIKDLHIKWGFRRITLETTAAQSIIVKDLRDNYIKPNGLSLVVEEESPTKKKEERIASTLEPKYENRQIWHYKGGFTTELEDELVMVKPPHDDLKDCLTTAIQKAVPPARKRQQEKVVDMTRYNKRFGGVSF